MTWTSPVFRSRAKRETEELGAKRTRRIERIQLPVDLDEELLSDILDVPFVDAKPTQHTANVANLTAEKRTERFKWRS